MKNFVTYLFLVIAISISNAQSFPHLNASTGNEGEFPVDKDTNIYMFIDYRIIKTDKNFNQIWSKSTGNNKIQHLLLSKTGTLYFIASDAISKKLVGKMDRSGNIVWLINLYPILPPNPGIPNFKQSHSILLDRNNHLVISGTIQNSTNSESGFFLKLDTAGNLLKLRKIDGPFSSNFSIAYDSSGYYKFISGLPVIASPPNQLAITTYDDLADQIVNSKLIYYKSGGSVASWRYIRSKFNNNFYIHLSYVPKDMGGFEVGLLKCNMSGAQKWTLLMSGFDGIPNNAGFSRSAVESSSGDLFFHHDANTYSPKYKSGIFKIDSSGTTNGIGIKIIDDFPSAPYSNQFPQTIDKDRHYIDVKTWPDPIELKTFNSNLSSPCALTTTCTYSLHPPALIVGNVTNTLQTLTTSFSSSLIPTATSLNPAIFHNNCTFIGILENSRNIQFHISPNPVKDVFYLNTPNDFVIEQVTLVNIDGKKVWSKKPEKSYNLSNVSTGIYILNITTASGTFHTKFIKE